MLGIGQLGQCNILICVYMPTRCWLSDHNSAKKHARLPWPIWPDMAPLLITHDQTCGRLAAIAIHGGCICSAYLA